MNTKLFPRWLRLAEVLTLLLAALAPASPVYANSCLVTTDADSGAGSLREMITNPACETITFDGDYTILLTSSLVIGRNMTIDGVGHSVTVSRNSSIAVQLLVVDAGATINLNNLTVANGRKGELGGGIGNWGTLNVTNVTVSDNWTEYCGGGIANFGVLNVLNSTFIENTADFGAGGAICNDGGTLTVANSTFSSNLGIWSGGAITNIEGTMNVTNSTFSGNVSTDAAISNGGTATVTNSTISGNGGGGGGFENSGTAAVLNTIVANNTSTNCLDYQGTLIASNNLADDDSCGPGFANSSSILLGPLADNGGPTQTMALLPGSAAIDAGYDAVCPTTDQRGVGRPYGAHCDIGAYEAEITASDTTPPTITLTTPAESAVYLLGQTVNADYACQDEADGSGLASCVGDVANGSPVDTGSIGAKTFTVEAADNAGNTASVTHTYHVIYNFTGFTSPVDNPSIMNTAKAGQTIPLKWRITDADGNPVTDLTGVSVTAVSLSCPSAPTTDAIEEYATSNSGLQNLGDGYYQWNWRSPTSYANTCKTLKLDLGEGAGFEHLALFQFRK